MNGGYSIKNSNVEHFLSNRLNLSELLILNRALKLETNEKVTFSSNPISSMKWMIELLGFFLQFLFFNSQYL